MLSTIFKPCICIGSLCVDLHGHCCAGLLPHANIQNTHSHTLTHLPRPNFSGSREVSTTLFAAVVMTMLQTQNFSHETVRKVESRSLKMKRLNPFEHFCHILPTFYNLGSAGP